MEEFFIYAKPHIGDVIPYTIALQPTSFPLQTNLTFNLIGSFLNVKNIYLSSNNIDIFDGNISYFNPFSAVKNLSSNNAGFSGIRVIDYIVNDNKHVTLTSPFNFLTSGFIDIIVENEAGFGVLSKDSRVPFLSSWKGAIDIQKPCINGVMIETKSEIDAIVYYISSEENHPFILENGFYFISENQ
jgi:hypothetical protein